MNAQIDLNGIEKTSFKLAAYGDGTTDLSMGLVFLLLGAYPLTRELLGPAWNMLFFLVFGGLIVAAQYLVRTRLGPSRIGLVKFGPRVKNRLRVALLITVSLALIMIAAWALAARGWFASTPLWLNSYGFEILVSFIVLMIMWGIAYALGLRRYYFYGLLLAAGFPIQAATSLYDGLPWLVAGGIIFLIGLYLLARFLKQYPPLDEGEEA
jgi:hypothetical protein